MAYKKDSGLGELLSREFSKGAEALMTTKVEVYRRPSGRIVEQHTLRRGGIGFYDITDKVLGRGEHKHMRK